MTAQQLWLTLIMPLLYTIAFFGAYEITGELPVPCFFLDYRVYGWFRVATKGMGVLDWIVFAVVLIGVGAAARRLQAGAQRRPLAISALTAL